MLTTAQGPITTETTTKTLISTSTVPPSIKPGLKLPKSPERWAEANLFFHSKMVFTQIEDLNAFVSNLQLMVYEYFASTCGTMAPDVDAYLGKYSNELQVRPFTKFF